MEGAQLGSVLLGTEDTLLRPCFRVERAGSRWLNVWGCLGVPEGVAQGLPEPVSSPWGTEEVGVQPAADLNSQTCTPLQRGYQRE